MTVFLLNVVIVKIFEYLFEPQLILQIKYRCIDIYHCVSINEMFTVMD